MGGRWLRTPLYSGVRNRFASQNRSQNPCGNAALLGGRPRYESGRSVALAAKSPTNAPTPDSPSHISDGAFSWAVCVRLSLLGREMQRLGGAIQERFESDSRAIRVRLERFGVLGLAFQRDSSVPTYPLYNIKRGARDIKGRMRRQARKRRGATSLREPPSRILPRPSPSNR